MRKLKIMTAFSSNFRNKGSFWFHMLPILDITYEYETVCVEDWESPQLYIGWAFWGFSIWLRLEGGML